MTSSKDPLGIVGTIVDGKYRAVEAVIGEGGFSVVYRAEHIIWKQPVALKCFNALAGVPAQLRQELLNGFIQEGKLMTNLSTRTAAIVQARDVGTLTAPSTQEQVPFMVLEWLEGRPLDRILHTEREGRFPARSIYDVLALLEPVASALEVAHVQNIAHRDIKPANLFVIGDPRGPGAFVKILDFGIAKVMAEHAHLQTSLAMTGREITAFTPNYGAPEQFSRAHGATGPWTDVFALALIMIELLRGGYPALQGDDYIQLAVASRDPTVRPTPRAFGVEVTDDVEAVFRRALAIAPRDRYKSAGLFWQDLHAAAFPGSAAWSPVTVGGGVSAAAFASPQTTPGGEGRHSNFGGPHSSGPGSTGPGTGPLNRSGLPDTGPGSRKMVSAPTTPLFAGGGTGAPITASAAPKKGSSALLLGGLAVVGLVGGVGAALLLFSKAPAPAASATVDSALPAPSASASAAAPVFACGEGSVLVPEGKFFMGSDEPGFPIWQPQHNVRVSTYCIDIHEVTTTAYKDCVTKGSCKRALLEPDYPKAEKTTPEQHEKNKKVFGELCNFGPNGEIKSGREKHPVNCVTWEMANLFCEWKGGRLPTEAEWEFAARGSDGRKYPWGDDGGGDPKYMNACGSECAAWEKAHNIEPKSDTMYEADDGFPGTAPVGSFPPGVTKIGTYDMVGNVWEWTNDRYASYTKEDQVDPKGALDGERRAIRGGGFNGGYPLWVNPSFRFHQLATGNAHGIGFRCAKSSKK